MWATSWLGHLHRSSRRYVIRPGSIDRRHSHSDPTSELHGRQHSDTGRPAALASFDPGAFSHAHPPADAYFHTATGYYPTSQLNPDPHGDPAAKTDPASPIFGMPILDVDKARTVVVIKRSLSPGFAGIPNPLFAADNCLMYFADGKKAVLDLVAAVKEM